MMILFRNAVIFILSFLFLLNASALFAEKCLPIHIDRRYEKKIDATYRKAMIAYSHRHYGIRTYKLNKPKILVLHFTDVPTLKETLKYFRGSLIKKRKDLNWGGNVNIGCHFIVDRDGTIYSLIPLNIMARHAVGFNYTAIGIENIANPKYPITRKQLISNLKLVRYIKQLKPSIKYIIGHHEYNWPKMPHYKLLRTLDKRYKPWNKYDPGPKFMRQIRYRLKRNKDKCYYAK